MEPTPMRPIWSGTISFVLINIPVRLYTASQEKSLDFNLLHKKDNSRIRYARICEIEEIVKEVALSLIEKLTGKFEAEKFKDDYYETMMKIIAQKARGKKITPLSAKPEVTEFEDLMAKLKESLEKAPSK